MADRDFDREAWSTRERALSTDFNFSASYAERALRSVLQGLTNSRVSASDDTTQSPPPSGFLGDGLKARPTNPASLAIKLTPGLGFFGSTTGATSIGGVIGVDDHQDFKPLVLSELETLVVPPNTSGNPRIDIIEVKFRRTLSDPASREVVQTNTGAPVASLVNKTLTWALDGQQGIATTPNNNTTPIGYKTGTPAGSPSAPPTSPGYIKIAEISVANGASSLSTSNIKDLRRVLAVYGQHRVAGVVSVARDTGTATLLEFSAPPGIEVDSVSGSAENNGRMQMGITISRGLPSLDVNRVSAHCTVDAGNPEHFPMVAVQVPSVTGDKLGLVFQSCVLKISVGSVLSPLETHPNPAIYRFSLSFW